MVNWPWTKASNTMNSTKAFLLVSWGIGGRIALYGESTEKKSKLLTELLVKIDQPCGSSMHL